VLLKEVQRWNEKREIGIMGGNGEDNDGLLCFLGYLFV
jgi:hypothetical protein